MKKYHLLWIIGAFSLIIGVSVVVSNTNSIIEKYPNLSVIISDVLLEPNESIDSFVTLEKDEKIFVTISTQPVSNTIYFSVNNLDNSFKKEIIFNELFSYQLIANTTESFNIVVGNMGPEISSVSGFTTKNPILDDEEITFIFGVGFILGSFSIIIGIILIIIGILIFIVKKKRRISKQ